MTTTGMAEAEMGQVASYIGRVLRQRNNDAGLAAVRDDVATLCSKFTPEF
jgi:glycine/serine hydroxymethyltransferase